MNNRNEEKFIFGGLFLLTNKLQVRGDQLFEEDGITLRQWFLTVMILQFRDKSPTLEPRFNKGVSKCIT